MIKDKEAVAVFDIGGTWFRSGLHTKAKGLTLLSKQPAYNYKNTAHKNVLELQNKLVDYLVQQVEYFHNHNPNTFAASISMGAALNGHTGEILNSGPLWGPACEKFDLLAALRERLPDIEWMAINDVSAALLRHVDSPQNIHLKRINLITVSSGIACRTYERDRKCIPLNEVGIQGEIGHIPIKFTVFDKTLKEICDCGGANHLNAFSSGRGIENVVRDIGSQDNPHRHFSDAVKANDVFALEILDAVTFPIADMIIHMLTIDPEIEKIVMTGGVVHSIERQYIQSLLKNLEQIGLYQVPDQPTFFRKIIELGLNDDNSGLLGAAIAYENRSANEEL